MAIAAPPSNADYIRHLDEKQEAFAKSEYFCCFNKSEANKLDIFTEKIEPLFDNSGLSDSELETAIGLPRSSIYKWRNKISKSYKNYIGIIAKYFGVTYEDLAGQSDPHRNLSEAEILSNKLITLSNNINLLSSKAKNIKDYIDHSKYDIDALYNEIRSTNDKQKVEKLEHQISIKENELKVSMLESEKLYREIEKFSNENQLLYITAMASRLTSGRQKMLRDYIEFLLHQQNKAEK